MADCDEKGKEGSGSAHGLDVTGDREIEEVAQPMEEIEVVGVPQSL